MKNVSQEPRQPGLEPTLEWQLLEADVATAMMPWTCTLEQGYENLLPNSFLLVIHVYLPISISAVETASLNKPRINRLASKRQRVVGFNSVRHTVTQLLHHPTTAMKTLIKNTSENIPTSPTLHTNPNKCHRVRNARTLTEAKILRSQNNVSCRQFHKS